MVASPVKVVRSTRTGLTSSQIINELDLSIDPDKSDADFSSDDDGYDRDFVPPARFTGDGYSSNSSSDEEPPSPKKKKISVKTGGFFKPVNEASPTHSSSTSLVSFSGTPKSAAQTPVLAMSVAASPTNASNASVLGTSSSASFFGTPKPGTSTPLSAIRVGASPQVASNAPGLKAPPPASTGSCIGQISHVLKDRGNRRCSVRRQQIDGIDSSRTTASTCRADKENFDAGSAGRESTNICHQNHEPTSPVVQPGHNTCDTRTRKAATKRNNLQSSAVQGRGTSETRTRKGPVRKRMPQLRDTVTPSTEGGVPKATAVQVPSTYGARTRSCPVRKQLSLPDANDNPEDEEKDEPLPNVDDVFYNTYDSDLNSDIDDIAQDTYQESWNDSEDFNPLPSAPCPEVPEWVGKKQSPVTYFKKYINDNMYETIALNTNIRYMQEKGKPLSVTADEVRGFFGVSMLMGVLQYPRVRMYWNGRTRLPLVADAITCKRYFVIRANLKLVDDGVVTEEDKSYKFWKVQPLLQSVRSGCLLNERSERVSIDEQMIPFWGHTSARQFVRGKPNPVGLKNFVSTSPDGLPLDFFIYEGKGDSILDDPDVRNLDIGGKVIIRLLSTLEEGSQIYMDRYFTSIPLLDLMHVKGMMGSGTLQKSRVPKEAVNQFLGDREMKSAGRGTMQQLVRSDGQVCLIKWFDNKPVMMASSIEGKGQPESVRRWSKTSREYVDVTRPAVIKSYNTNMGGVDLLDRVIASYRMSTRTRKWTVRTIMHFFDFSCAAAWIEYRRDAAALHLPRKRTLDYMDFRISICDDLMYSKTDTPTNSDDEVDDPSYEPLNGSNSHIPGFVPQPPNAKRKAGAKHMPEVQEKPQRCRMPGCTSNKARALCSVCNVYLCSNVNRSCFSEFHKM